jgi:CRP/FNR family transcriptional regulator
VDCRNCIVELTCYRVETRFAQLFLKLAERVGERGADGVFIPIRLSRMDLAEMVGTTIETAIRVMSRWRSEGVVETRRGGFLLRDREALEALACG